jgi:hypothetical protein
MALNGSDRKLIDELASNLRARYEEEVTWDAVTKEDVDGEMMNIANTSPSTPVAITKDDLRNNSGRQIVRDAYLNEVASALSQKVGIAAHADLDKGIVYAHAVPDAHYENKPMSITQLKKEAQRAKERNRDEDE